ncbi:MAG: hypothetical protein RR543_04860 [Erysipelotrichales bacterium]
MPPKHKGDNKIAKSKLVNANKKIAKNVTKGFNKMSDAVVGVVLVVAGIGGYLLIKNRTNKNQKK